MNYSGIALGAVPEHEAQVRAAIDDLGWAEVHGSDGRGRMVVVIEGASTDEELERLQALRRLPHVLSAEMVIHYFEDEARATVARPAGEAGPERLLNADDEDLRRLGFFQRHKRLSNG